MTWLYYALFTTLAWGVWGALIELPEKEGFPATLSYVVWSITMIPCALLAIRQRGWKVEHSAKSIVYGCLVGFLGAGGQLILFQALRHGPAYIVFPVVSLYPVVTVALSTTLLKESASRRQWIGVAIALPAIVLISIPAPDKPKDAEEKSPNAASLAADAAVGAPLQQPLVATGAADDADEKKPVELGSWLFLAILVFAAWGVQAYFMKSATASMSAEGLFFYMALTAVLLAPIAWMMTELKTPIQWNIDAGWPTPWAVAGIQVLNALGALTLVHAMRTGKAMIVAPMTALAPLITIILSLAIHQKDPTLIQVGGLTLAVVAIFLLAE